MTNVKLLSDLLTDFGVICLSDDSDCGLSNIVHSICTSYSFTQVLQQISEELKTCNCTPLCKLIVASSFIRLCTEDYLLQKPLQEEVQESVPVIEKHPLKKSSDEENVKQLLCISHHADVAEFKDREFYDYTEEDFPKADARAISLFRFFTLLFQIPSFTEHYLSKNYSIELVASLCSLAASHAEPAPWTSSTSVQEANNFIKTISNLYSCDITTELLVSTTVQGYKTSEDSWHSKSIFRKVLTLNQPRLRKENCHKNPFAKAAFYWCLMQVKHPNLSFYLDQVLTPVLLFVDDFVNEHKMFGIKCLNHIIDNVSKEELRWYSRDAVIFDALKQQLFTQEACVLEASLSCLLSILAIIEKPPSKLETVAYNRYDEIFMLVLYNAEMENKLVFRRIYTSFIPKFIETLGITVVRHTKSLLRLTEFYLEIYDSPNEAARLNVLCSIKKLIEVAWPRVTHHNDTLVKILLKLIYDVSVEDVLTIPKDVKQKVINEAIEILITLKRLEKNRIENLLHAVSGKLKVFEFQAAIETVLNSSA